MKQFVSLVLALCLACGLAAPALADIALREAPLTHEAPPEIGAPEDLALNKGEGPLSGSCGATAADDVKWQLTQNNTDIDDPTYTLTISGTGAMADFSNDHPWRSFKEKITEVVIESGVEKIGGNAFRDHISITTVTLSETLTKIGHHAFFKTDIAHISIPNSVKQIEYCAFEGCSKLENIAIPDSVTDLGGRTFYACTTLESASIGSGISALSDAIFYGCTALKTVILSAGLTSIGRVIPGGNYAAATFGNCSSLESIQLPSSVTTIGIYAFNGCTALCAIDLSPVTTIQAYSFLGCTSLQTVKLGNGLTHIGEYAFQDCQLENICFPDSLEKIEMGAFKGNDLTVISCYYIFVPWFMAASHRHGTSRCLNC